MSNTSLLRIALWNVQGIKSPSSQILVHDFLTSLKVDVVALAVTNLPTPPHLSWKNFPNSCWSTTTPTRGTGAALLCTGSIRLISSRTSSDARLVEASIQVGSATLNVAVVYAPAEATARRTWMESHLIPDHISLPSIDLLLGDFNCPPEPSGRTAGSFHLKAFVDFCGLTRIPPANTDYTLVVRDVRVLRQINRNNFNTPVHTGSQLLPNF
jgi:hypothetical protein